jgi:hypothetical protein
MRVLLSLFMLWCLGYPALAQDRDYGRSTVVRDRGVVATSQVLASRAVEPMAPLSRRPCRRSRSMVYEYGMLHR